MIVVPGRVDAGGPVGPILPGWVDEPIDLASFTTVRVPGVQLWLFAVDDGGEAPVWSGERTQGGGIFVVRCAIDDVGTLTETDWQQVLALTDALAQFPVDSAFRTPTSHADHWHIYAHGRHWIAFSMADGADGVGIGLLTLDDSLAVVTGPTRLYRSVAAATNVATNDLFMCETPTGVVIFFKTFPPARAGEELTLVEATAADPSLPDVAVGMVTDPLGLLAGTPMANGGSAYYEATAAEPYVLLVPSTLAPSAASVIQQVRLDAAFEVTEAAVVRSRVDRGYAMPMRAVIPSLPALSFWCWRTISLPPVSGEVGTLDSWVWDAASPRHRHLQRRVASIGNRPHVPAFSDRIVIAYDTSKPYCSVCLVDYAP